MRIKDLGRYVLLELIFDLIIIIIFIFFSIIAMGIIKTYIEAQFPPVEQIINGEIGHVYKAEIFNVCMRTIQVKYNNDEIIMYITTNDLYRILPFIVSGIMIFLITPLLKRIKHVLRYIL